MTMREGVEVRSLLSSEQLEEMDGRLAVVDVSPTTGVRFVNSGWMRFHYRTRL